MKTIVLIVALVLGLGLVTGCKPSNRVTFKPALISIDPGAGWERQEIPVNLPACSPRLESKAGMINALLIEDETDIKKAADALQASMVSTGRAVPDSFKREDFSTDSGLGGVHISYTTKAVEGGAGAMRSHSFVTHNMVGKCVSISYITSTEAESAAVLEAIRKTLRVE